MFLTDDFCYVDMPKTGTVAVNNWLKELFPDRYFKHHEKPNADIVNSGRLLFGTYRDPHSFYLSLWTYGCTKRERTGGVYSNLTSFRLFKSLAYSKNKLGAIRAIVSKLRLRRSLDIEYHKRLYADKNDPELFRQWLRIVLDPKYACLLSGSYYYSGIHKLTGLYSWYMLTFYFKDLGVLTQGKVRSEKELLQFVAANCYIDEFIDQQNLFESFQNLMREHQFLKNNAVLDRLEDRPMNSSKSGQVDHMSFYTDELVKLVESRESVIVQLINNRYLSE
ncbi:hypothetical protein [Aureitalea marina]|uniref:Sulfotransferase domain-containing protein n=1 Tax=Aureitalea marina TaxID=930804 RepID=A0A2S7KNS7_9FLAO|nr:hypothetical protein [Aureitalea marina]PQB04238.1 hypothetical protein BST85_04460 [Aureitalea marina]